jgi:hypothetical protein
VKGLTGLAEGKGLAALVDGGDSANAIDAVRLVFKWLLCLAVGLAEKTAVLVETLAMRSYTAAFFCIIPWIRGRRRPSRVPTEP